jgi:hypothetical protein
MGVSLSNVTRVPRHADSGRGVACRWVEAIRRSCRAGIVRPSGSRGHRRPGRRRVPLRRVRVRSRRPCDAPAVPDVPRPCSGKRAARSRSPLPDQSPAHYTFRMAEPARRTAPGNDAPLFDPLAVDRAYLQERARRRARTERSRARRRAGLRFWLVVVVLIAVSVLITLTIWREVGRLFGL